MDEIEQTSKIKILNELKKNGRVSVSEIADKIDLSRQTVAKIINNMEKNKEIWGYTAIFDPKLVGKKPFIVNFKLDFTINPEDFLKKGASDERLKENEEIYGVQTSYFTNGKSDFMYIFWAKDIIEAKKMVTIYRQIYKENIKDADLFEGMATLRCCGILNPKILEESRSILI